AWLQNDRGDFDGVRIQQLTYRFDVVWIRHQHRLADRLWYACRRRRVEWRLIAGHGVVVPAVEVSGEPNDLLAARIRPSVSHGEHGGFGSAHREAHPFGAGHQSLDLLGPGNLQLVAGT